MADGSGLIVRGRVIHTYGPNGPRLREVGADQVIVGCCNRCDTVGVVDRAMWPLSNEMESFVWTLRLQLLCVACHGKDVILQLWPVTPYPGDQRRSAFQRWR